MLHGQAEALMPAVAAAMDEAGLAAAALDLVAVAVGPGSFTGVRAGLAAARGIALALAKPVLGVTAFEAAAEATAAGAADDRGGGPLPLLVAIESRRRELYVQLFDAARRPLADPAAIMPEALADSVHAVIGAAPLVVAGDAAARALAALAGRRRAIAVEDPGPTAVGVARAALRRWRAGDWGGTGERGGVARALYLRPPDVTLGGGHRGPAAS